MVAFYKAKAPEILKDVPSAFHLKLAGFFVGQYDPAKSVFPFTDARGQKKPTVLTNVEPNNDLKSCGVAGMSLGPNDMFSGGSPEYIVNFKPITVSELAMDEASARKFIESLRFARPGMGRAVQLIVELEIIQTPMKLPLRGAAGRYPPVNFNGTVKKITVIAGETSQPIGSIVP